MEDKDIAFKVLQKKLGAMWASMQTMSPEERTIVVVPAMPPETGSRGARLQGLEERLLFLLLLLRQPRVRLIYVTSLPIHPDVIDYYLGLLPGVSVPHARKRLFHVTPLDGSPVPLSQKILERPRLVERIRSLIPDVNRAHLVPFCTTELDRDLALALGIPMYGADPATAPLGTKSGCRKLFRQVGVRCPAGEEDLYSLEELAQAITRMRLSNPSLHRAIVKLNESAAGRGNASVDLSSLSPPGSDSELATAVQCLQAMTFENTAMTLERYLEKLGQLGGIIEERVSGTEIRSPSAQLRVTPLGEVEALSTHDQILGGPTGQAYRGCRFPADPGYAAAIMREAMKVGAKLASEGVIGRFAIDFVTVRRESDGTWDVYAIEINLRKGGTTHPFLTLQYLTDGTYDAQQGVFTNPSGQRKCLIATDHLESPIYRALDHESLLDIVARHSLHFDQRVQRGIVLHMLNGVAELGILGLTAVADTSDDTQKLFDAAVAILDTEARLAAGQTAV